MIDAKPCERCHAIELTGHHQVEHHCVRLGLICFGESLCSIRSVPNLVAFAGEKRPDHATDVGLVVNDQD